MAIFILPEHVQNTVREKWHTAQSSLLLWEYHRLRCPRIWNSFLGTTGEYDGCLFRKRRLSLYDKYGKHTHHTVPATPHRLKDSRHRLTMFTDNRHTHLLCQMVPIPAATPDVIKDVPQRDYGRYARHEKHTNAAHYANMNKERVPSMPGHLCPSSPQGFVTPMDAFFPCKGREAGSHAKYQSQTPYFP